MKKILLALIVASMSLSAIASNGGQGPRYPGNNTWGHFKQLSAARQKELIRQYPTVEIESNKLSQLDESVQNMYNEVHGSAASASATYSAGPGASATARTNRNGGQRYYGLPWGQFKQRSANEQIRLIELNPTVTIEENKLSQLDQEVTDAYRAIRQTAPASQAAPSAGPSASSSAPAMRRNGNGNGGRVVSTSAPSAPAMPAAVAPRQRAEGEPEYAPIG